MALTIFHPETRRLFRARRGKQSPFNHSFGGAVDYSGLACFPPEPPVHLLFRLNTDDAAVGVQLSQSKWLPLLCAIRYGACDLGYRVISDQEVEILHQKESRAWPEFPYEGYPEKLPPQPVLLEEIPYDPGSPRDALVYAGIFGYDALTSNQRARLALFVVEEGIYDPEVDNEETPEAFLEANTWPFVQGLPEEDCPNRSCKLHGRPGSLRILAIFQEEEKEVRKLWGPNCGSLQIIYQICPVCGALRTTNQCT